MDKFLEFVVNKLLKEKPLSEIHQYTLIVPSQRAKWHLKKLLLQNKKKVYILPELQTIQNYFNSKSPLFPISNLEAKFILFEEALKLDRQLSYNDFQIQSNVLLKSFNDVERNLIDHKKLFQELNNISELENWSLNENNLSKNQEKFIFQFKQTGELFLEFRKKLISEKKGTSGLINRIIAENLEKYLLNEKNIIFLGLNALSKSEELIINYLKEKNGEILVDVDNFYVKNQNHEAGYFYRKHQNNSYNPPFDKIRKDPKNISIYAANSSNQQIDIAKEIISQNSKEYAVLLMDESIGPIVHQKLLNARKSINLASGLKYKNFENQKLITFLLESEPIISTKKINYQWVENLMSFSAIKSLVDRKKINKLFIQGNTKRYEIHILKLQKIHPLMEKIFRCLTNIFMSLENIKSPSRINDFLKIIESLYTENLKEKLSIQISIEEAGKIENMLHQYNLSLDVKDFIKIFINEINSKSVVVSGENDANIQIIGLLESRLIDYENIIFLSCNEEFLPSNPNSEDLFPEDLKRHFGIPSGYERQAISAYYFYRCFHFAKNIDLIYVKEESKGLNFNEPSRYIRQVEKEMGVLKNIRINNFKVKIENSSYSHQVINNELIKELIVKWIAKGVSPSALMKYHNCPLDFYMKYISKIEEKKEPERYLNPLDWGIAVHKTLENLFYQNRKITAIEIQKIQNELESIMLKTFNEIFLDKRYSIGKNILIYHHFKKCIENLLKKELNRIKLFGDYKILETEKTVSNASSISINGDKRPIKLVGQIDRIDLTNDGIRLVDYKTGLISKSEISLNGFNQLHKKEKAFQLFFYGLLWNEENLNMKDISCQIISLKNTISPHLDLNFNKNNKIKNHSIVDFKKWLFLNIESIYNTPSFSHLSESLFCELC